VELGISFVNTRMELAGVFALVIYTRLPLPLPFFVFARLLAVEIAASTSI